MARIRKTTTKTSFTKRKEQPKKRKIYIRKKKK